MNVAIVDMVLDKSVTLTQPTKGAPEYQTVLEIRLRSD